MALANVINKLKSKNAGAAKNTPVFLSKNAKTNYYKNIHGILDNKVSDDTKPKFSKPIDSIHDFFVKTGDLEDRSGNKDVLPKSDNISSLNTPSTPDTGFSSVGKQETTNPLLKPLEEISAGIKTQSAEFKLVNTELKTHTKLLGEVKDAIATISTGGNGGLMDMADGLFSRKGKGKKFGRGGARGLKIPSKPPTGKLGGLGNIIKSSGNAIKNIAGRALTTGLESPLLRTAGQTLMRSSLPAVAVTAAASAGYGVGTALYNKFADTDIMKSVGEGGAKVMKFFGNDEATQAVADTEKYKGFGSVVAKNESGGNAAMVSSGHGDKGGKSYGLYQLSSKTKDVDKFVKESGFADKFAGLKPGSAEFDAKWKELAKDPAFVKAQTDHAVKTHYNPQMEKLKKGGVDLSSKGGAVKEAILSTANQYGANTDVITKALAGKDVSKMSDKDIVNAIQDYKAATVKTRFKSSSAEVQAGVAKRIERERQQLLAIKDEDKTNVADNKSQPQKGDLNPANKTPVVISKTDNKVDNKPTVASNKTVGGTQQAQKGDLKPSNKEVTPIDINGVNVPKIASNKANNTVQVDNFKASNTDGKSSSELSYATEESKQDVANNTNGLDNSKVDLFKPIGDIETILSKPQVNNVETLSSLQPTMQPASTVVAQSKEYNSLTAPQNKNTITATPVESPNQGSVVSSSGGNQVAQTNNNSSGNKTPEKLAVRDISPTIQRILDKDFHLGV